MPRAQMTGAFLVLSLLTWAIGGAAQMPTDRAAIVRNHGSGEIDVRFVLSTGEETAPANGDLVLERADGDVGGRVEAAFRQSETRVALPASSTWRLSVRVPGHWAPSGVVRIDTERRTVSIPLLPTGEVRGRLSVPDAASDLPEYLYASLESPRANAPARRVSGGLFACPIDQNGSFRCELPAELLDLVLRVEGFVPLYRWDVRVREDEPRDLGRIGLDPGSSIAGWAVTEDRTPLPEGAKAYLAPRIAGVADPILTARLRRGADIRSLGEDGFFQFSGVAPGVYTVVVEAPGYATATVDPVEVLAANETLLRRPTVLRTPLDLVLQFEPPLDWRGRPWRLVVSRASDAGRAFDQRPFFDQAVGEDGRVVLRDQAPGLFAVRVTDSDDNIFWYDSAWPIQSQADASRRIEISLVEVEGEATLGDSPLSAEIWFGGRFGARRIGLESDEEGRYRATLPEGGDWWVDVTSREEDVRRSMLVEVVPSSDGEAVVDLHVPDTELYGFVVDAADEPVPSAALSLGDALGGSTSAATDNEGRFRIRGLPEGDASLVASRGGPTPTSTSEVTVPIQEGAPTGPVVLRLVESRTVGGIVLLDGVPVPGAQVKAFPESGGLGATARTDVMGRFSFELRADAELFHVEVAPPRGGLTGHRVELTDGENLVLETASDPGSIRIVLPEEDTPRSMLRVYQDEQLLSGSGLADWLRGNGTPILVRETRDFVLPRMAPGSYRLCYGEPGDEIPCTSGYLAPGGSLELSLR